MNILGVWSILLFSACSIPKVAMETESLKMPSDFSNAVQDTASDGVLPWTSLFSDTILKGHIEKSLLHNPDMRSIMQRVEAAAVESVAQRNTIIPEVGATVGAGTVRFGDYTVDGVGNFDTNLSDNVDESRRIPNPVPDLLLGLNTSWEAGLWGKYKNRKRRAQEQLLATAEGRRWIQTMLVAQVSKYYYDLVALDAEIRMIDRSVQLQESALEVVKIQKEGGRVNELAVKQFESQLLDFKALEKSKRLERVLLENEMNALIGNFGGEVRRADSLQWRDLPLMLRTGKPETLLKQRPDVKAAMHEREAALANLRVAQAYFYPDLSFQGFFGVNSFRPDVLFTLPASMAFTALGGLAAPIINRNTIKRNHRVAIAEYNQSHFSYKKSLLLAFREVNDELQKISYFETIAEYRNDQRKVMAEAENVSAELFTTGYANYVELLMIRNSRLAAEIEYIEAVRDRIQATIGLYRALGGGQ